MCFSVMRARLCHPRAVGLPPFFLPSSSILPHHKTHEETQLSLSLSQKNDVSRREQSSRWKFVG